MHVHFADPDGRSFPKESRKEYEDFFAVLKEGGYDGRVSIEAYSENKEKEKDDVYGSFTKFPDLLLMDGGRGQVNIAKEVLEELHLSIPVCGMVKDDHHRTRGLYYEGVEQPIDPHSEGFKLITRVQDEAHRFAIEYHRSLHNRNSITSVLDHIQGIGPVKRNALLSHFQSVDDIKKADIQQLMEVPGITEKNAESIRAYFKKEKNFPVA